MKQAFLAILGLLVFVGTANARVRHITEWQDYTSARVVDKKQTYETCADKCPGYDLTVTHCSGENEELEKCDEPGCGYYYRCVKVN